MKDIDKISDIVPFNKWTRQELIELIDKLEAENSELYNQYIYYRNMYRELEAAHDNNN